MKAIGGHHVRALAREWLVRVYRGRSADGRRRYLNKTIHGTKRQAQQWLTKTLHDITGGSFAEPSRRTVGGFLDNWLVSIAKQRLGPRSFTDYTNLIRRYIRPALGDQPLFQLTPADVQRLYGELSSRGLSPRVVRYTHAVLRSALKQAMQWNMIARNPCDRKQS